jgi:gliding motility-associated-like protein
MKRKLLLIAGMLLIYSGLSAQDVVINKVYNSDASSPSTGSNDVVELLVLKDKTDMRGMYIKDVTSALVTSTVFGDGGAKFMFADHPLWRSLRSGTTIVIRRAPSGSYTQDLDPADRKIDLMLVGSDYFKSVRSAGGTAGTFALGSYDLVVLKAANAGGIADGAADGFNNIVHAFLPVVNAAITNSWNALTGPDGTTASSRKIGGTAIIPTNGFIYPANLTGTIADYNGLSSTSNPILISSGNAAIPTYGNGEPGKNAAFITYLRNAPVVDTTYSESAPNETTVTFNVKFSKPVTGVTLSDFSFSITGTVSANLNSVTGTGDTYTVTAINVSGEGLLTLNTVAFGTGITDGVNPILEGIAYTGGMQHIVGKVPPVVLPDQQFGANVNAENGDFVGLVKATLLGEGAVDGWFITGGNANNEFAIDASGKITVANKSAFNFDVKSEYLLTVTATNGSKRVSLPATVVVKLLKAPGTPETVGAYNGIVSTRTPLLRGTLSATNNTLTDYSPFLVTLYADGNVISDDIAPDAGTGVWSFKFSTPLNTGKHNFYITATYNGALIGTSPSLVVSTIESGWTMIPGNILTPNGDGKNDTWKVVNIEYFTQNEVTIFNKLGEVVFYKKGYQNDWDGISNGVSLNSGTYYYQIKLGPLEKPLKGYITLIRR